MLALLLMSSKCGKEPVPEPPRPEAEQTVYDYAYGSHPQQRMDVYIPYGVRDTMALIVMVHGGSWYGGDRSMFSPWFEYERAQQRFALINVDYRLDTPETAPIPMQTDDIAAAIEAVRRDFHLPAKRIAMAGGSAGGHLATYYAYKYDTQHDVKVVIDYVGPVDFTDPQYHTPGHWSWIFSGIEYIFGVPYEGHEDYYREVSPYYHVSAQSPPTIMFYGGQDTLVPYTQGERLHRRLDEFQVENQYYFYPNSGHIFNREDGLDAFNKAEIFMLQHLRNAQ